MTSSSNQQVVSRPVVSEREQVHPATPRPLSFCQPPGEPSKDVLTRSTRRFSEVPRLNKLEADLSRLLSSEEQDVTLCRPLRLSGGTRRASVGPQVTPLSIAPRTVAHYTASTCDSSLSTPTINPDVLESDALSSVYDFEIYDFPEPPPMGSPVIRRMRSSPWFPAAEGHRTFPYTPSPEAQTFSFNSGDFFRRKDIAPDVPSYGDVFGSEGGLLPVDVVVEERSLTRIDSRRRSVCGVNTSPSLFEDSSTMDGTCVASLLTHARSSTLTSAKQDMASERPSEESIEGVQKPCKEQSTAPRLPRIIRKVASMRTEPKREHASALPFTKAGQRPVPKVRSFHSILGNSDNKQAMIRERRESWHMSAERPFWAIRKEQEATRSRATKGMKPERKQKEPQALRMSKRFSTSHDIFEAGGSLAQSGTQPELEDHNQSFLDFGSSSSGNLGGTKDKVKTLLSRASGFFVQWTKKAKPN